MFYIKTILFPIIIVIIAYVLLDVMDTRKAILKANNPYTQEQIDFTAYGPEGKEKALAYQKENDKYIEIMKKKNAKYMKKMNLEREEKNKKIEAQKAVEYADANLKNKLIIKGKISEYGTYILRVYYVAQKDSFFCTTFSLFDGISPKSKFFEYIPTLSDNHHKVIFPTDEISWFNYCDYQLNSIYMDSEIIFEKKNNKLEFIGNVYPQSPYPKVIKLRKVWKNQYTVDVYENPYSQIKNEQENRSQKVTLDTRDIDNVVSQQLRKELNLLAKAFDAYNQVHRKKLTAEEGKKLLRNEQDLSKFIPKEELKEYLQELKTSITYKNGNPIDPWGHPYKYRADYAIIYSDGAESFEYKNDLSHKLKRFKTRKQEAIRQMSNLAELFTTYINKMGYAPTKEEAKKLFRHEENLAKADFYDSRGLERYNKIPKSEGNPIDPWGHPYQYREENVRQGIDAAIFSLGKDRIKSSDDIFFYDIYFNVRAPSQIKRNYPRGNSPR